MYLVKMSKTLLIIAKFDFFWGGAGHSPQTHVGEGLGHSPS